MILVIIGAMVAILSSWAVAQIITSKEDVDDV